MLYERLLEELFQQKIRYVLAGGMAVILHGVPRLTMDIDLVVELEPKNLKKFITIMSQLGYRPKNPVDPFELADVEKREEWTKKKNMIVFSFYQEKNLADIVDVFVEEPIPFDELYRERVVGHLGPIEVNLAAIPHIVIMKEQAGRQQDLDDIEQLQRLQKRQKADAAKKKSKKRV